MTLARIDPDTLHALISQEPLTEAAKRYGEDGSRRMKGVLRFLKKCARHSTVVETSKLTIFAPMEENTLIDAERPKFATAFNFGVTARGSIQELLVEIREDGSAYVWSELKDAITDQLETCIVYRLNQSVETFSIGKTRMPVPKIVQGAVSQYCINSFIDLSDALNAYRDNMARTSKCHLLREAWAEENRMWFRTKPEFRLRRALANHLYSYLRHDEISVREEQNVDDSHPVDIKLVWRMENRTAIIEVKWLGKSIEIDSRKISQDYTASRAKDGAKQLAEYLESHKQEDAKEDTRGYLVIFDCRRWRLNADAVTVTRKNGFWYESAEIDFSPEYHVERDDFEPPFRMFLEPVCL